MPYQLIGAIVICGNPASAIVGTSGRNDTRFSHVYASAFNFPALMCGSPSGAVANIIGGFAREHARDGLTGALVGTCTICVPARALKSSPARCCVLPTPGVE